MTRTVVASIEAEFRRYKALAEGAMDQISEAELSASGSSSENSIAVIVWHISGNLASRFTDFLTTDGEKPWRHRDEEFVRRQVSRDELLEKWEAGWAILVQTLGTLADDDLARTVQIRAQPLSVVNALHRALAHVAYHVGQIVLIAKATRGADWRYLSIPPGQSEVYNKKPANESPGSHADQLRR